MLIFFYIKFCNFVTVFIHNIYVIGVGLQSIMSTVLRLQLGGQGYKPDSNCPIVENCKPLSEVVNAVNKWQEIIEEETDGE